MVSGLTFLRPLVDRVNGFLAQPGGAGYFHIELSSQYAWYIAPVRLILLALTGVLGVSILWCLVQTGMVVRDRYDVQARLDHVRMQDSQLLTEAQQEGLDLSEPSLQRLPAEVGLANQLLTKRSFSWTRFLSALEATVPRHVSIKSIRMDFGNMSVYMTGLAVTVEDVTALTVTLQSHALFHDPVLGQHRVGPDGLVEFDLTVHYRQLGL